MKILSVLFLCFTYVSLFAQTHTRANHDSKTLRLTSILATADGGKISLNTTKKSYGKGEGDILLTKTNREGNEEWFQSYGGSSYDLASSVSLTQDGGYIISASTSSFGAGNYDVYVIKTDAQGNTEWSQTYGGFSNEYGQNIQETKNGEYLLTASSQRFISKKEVKDDPKLIWTINIDKNGKEIK